jgi:hypothetical protein
MAYLVEGDVMKAPYDYNNTTFGFLKPFQNFMHFSNSSTADSTIADIVENYVDPSSNYTYSLQNEEAGFMLGGEETKKREVVLTSNLPETLVAIYNSEDSTICNTGITLDNSVAANNMLLVIGEEHVLPLSITLTTNKLFYLQSDTSLFIFGQLLDSETAGVSNAAITITVSFPNSSDSYEYSTLSDITGKYRRNIDISNYTDVNLNIEAKAYVNEIQFTSDTVTITYIEEKE